jgi:thiamine-phosphate pyrophosphorylase
MLAPLYAIVDEAAARQAGLSLAGLAEAYLRGGARLLQVRAKTMTSGELVAASRTIVGAARRVDARVVVNDRADIARVAGADGVHVGQTDLSVADARAVVGSRALVGVSTHTLEQVDEALATDASYVAVGPVFGTTTKDTGYDAVGLELVRHAVTRAGGRPVVAIGGITLETAGLVIEAGAASVAVISDLVRGDPERRVRAWVQRLGRLREGPSNRV